MKIAESYTCAAAAAAGLADATICTGAGPWVPNIATSSADSLAHKITITQAGASNHSAKTATITGTNADGQPQTETGLALPNGAATVTSTKFFATVTSVAISATIGADTMTMGWAVDAVSPWARMAAHGPNHQGFNLGIGCSVLTGSPNYTVQITCDGEPINHATIASKTAAFAGQQAYPVTAIRLLFAVAGGVKMTALQY